MLCRRVFSAFAPKAGEGCQALSTHPGLKAETCRDALRKAEIDQTQRWEALHCAEDSRPTAQCFLSLTLCKSQQQTSPG